MTGRWGSIINGLNGLRSIAVQHLTHEVFEKQEKKKKTIVWVRFANSNYLERINFMCTDLSSFNQDQLKEKNGRIKRRNE